VAPAFEADLVATWRSYVAFKFFRKFEIEIQLFPKSKISLPSRDEADKTSFASTASFGEKDAIIGIAVHLNSEPPRFDKRGPKIASVPVENDLSTALFSYLLAFAAASSAYEGPPANPKKADFLGAEKSPLSSVNETTNVFGLTNEKPSVFASSSNNFPVFATLFNSPVEGALLPSPIVFLLVLDLVVVLLISSLREILRTTPGFFSYRLFLSERNKVKGFY
jgi:hypothetical protein